MQLLTEALRRKLPPLYSQENVADPTVVAYFFNPSGTGRWWITEGSPEGDDFIMFGLCDLGWPELGYVSLNELQSVKGPLGIERDLHWTPRPLSVITDDLAGLTYAEV